MSAIPFNTTPTPLFTVSRIGWLGLGESRLILMDALGGFRTLREQIAQELGQEAEADMAQRAGYASAERLVAAGLGSGDLTCDEAGFHKALGLITAAGYGQFRASEVRMADRWAKVSVDSSVEGWMFRESGGRISAGCDYTRGLLAGVMHFLASPAFRPQGRVERDVPFAEEAFPDHPSSAASDGGEVSCIETGCIATGEESCCFVLGPPTLLLAEGLSPVYGGQSSVRETLLRLNRQLEQILDTSRKDSLTKLYNRSHFEQSLRQRIGFAKRRSDVVSLAIIDVDSFKSINDTQGHSIGDRVLRQVARALENQAREDDVVARLGGDEFVWLMPATVAETALLVAQRFRKTIGDLAPSIGFGVSVSIGVASYPQDSGSPAELYERADIALFAAKRGGRDQAVRYNNSMSNPTSSMNGRDSSAGQSERPMIRNGENLYSYGAPQPQPQPQPFPAPRSAQPDSRIALPQIGKGSSVRSTSASVPVSRPVPSRLLEPVGAPGRAVVNDLGFQRERLAAVEVTRRFGKKKRY